MPYSEYIKICVLRDTSSCFYLPYKEYNKVETINKLEQIQIKLETLRDHRETSFLVKIYSLQKDLCYQRLFELNSELD